MRESASVAIPNSDTYQKLRVVKSYAGFEELFPAEVEIFRRYARQFAGSVLDIAVGGGRTTRALFPAASRYVGIDFSTGMIALARQLFPAADLRQMDMREAPQAFAGQKFDAVLISFNGIDYISWDERNALLLALSRMLTPGGVLAFSTHDLAAVNENRGFRIREDLRLNWKTFSTTPLLAAKKLTKLPFWISRALPNFLRHRPLERIFDGFAYVNDSGENYGLVTCYVSTTKQNHILESARLENVEVLQPWLVNEPAAFNYIVCTARA